MPLTARQILAIPAHSLHAMMECVVDVLTTHGVTLAETLRADVPEIMALMDDHAPSVADDVADAINEYDPSILCDRYGDYGALYEA